MRGFLVTRPPISRVLSRTIIYLALLLPTGSSGFCDITTADRLNVITSPCSRQGLPLFRVTTTDCELLPHSFHLFPEG